MNIYLKKKDKWTNIFHFFNLYSIMLIFFVFYTLNTWITHLRYIRRVPDENEILVPFVIATTK